MSVKPCSIFIGFDPREAAAFAVARASIRRRLTAPIPVRGLVLADLQRRGLYTRPTRMGYDSEGRRVIIDELSARPDYDGRCSTEFAISRFLVPHLAKSGWALFLDCDMLVRWNLARLFEVAGSDPSKAVWCVKHDHRPDEGSAKMDGQVQTAYARKNWSSVCLWNVEHPANRALTLDLVNTAPGRDLHAFSWLADADIGELGTEWNWLAGHSSDNIDPKIVHHTDGSPCMAGYESAPYADEWRAELEQWAA